MLQITCPWCGVRDETDFVFGGEAHVIRPENPETITDKEWADYLFYEENPKGPHYERWQHRHGCRRWFNVVRDTVTHEILHTYKLNEVQPQVKKVAVKQAVA